MFNHSLQSYSSLISITGGFTSRHVAESSLKVTRTTHFEKQVSRVQRTLGPESCNATSGFSNVKIEPFNCGQLDSPYDMDIKEPNPRSMEGFKRPPRKVCIKPKYPPQSCDWGLRMGEGQKKVGPKDTGGSQDVVIAKYPIKTPDIRIRICSDNPPNSPKGTKKPGIGDQESSIHACWLPDGC